MATTYRARAWRYARDIILRREPDLTREELQAKIAAKLNGSLVALARINLTREAKKAAHA